MPQVIPISNRERMLTKYASDGMYARQAKEYTKLLQAYDKNLIAKWLFDQQRWSIWTRDRKGLAYLVYVCVDKETNGYRKIGQKDLEFIGAMDNYRKNKGYNILKKIDEHNDKLTEEKKKELQNLVFDSCHERWRQYADNPMIPVGISF